MNKLINGSVYSIIKDEYEGKNISDAFVYLVKVVLKTVNYNNFKIQDLCSDFQKLCGFRIPYHPMTVIVNQLRSQGFVCDSRAGGFIPIKEKLDEDVSTEPLIREQESLSRLLTRFIQFAKGQREELNLTIEDAEKIINDFIELNGINLLRGSLDYSAITDNEYIRLFYLFYNSLLSSDLDAVEYIGSLIVGRILTDLFISGQNKGAGNSKSNAVVYLDTSVVFSLLGIDAINRVDVYKELLSATKNMGMRIKVFYHTYIEMMTLIEGSRRWIGNPEYNPIEATAATRFFVKNNYSRDQISDYASNLEHTLNGYGIEIDHMSYPDVCPRGVQSEQYYYDLIVAKYRETSADFDEKEKQGTLDKDARSLFFIDYLNAGIRARQIQNISNIFVTGNNSLASVSKSRTITDSSEIPDCVNDIYWGTLIWLNNPQQLLSAAKVRVAANAYAAFLPSTILIRKLVDSANLLEKSEAITPEEAYFLKTSSLAQKMLMELTKGDDKCFSEKTSLDILRMIKDDAKLQGRSEERDIAQGEISILNKQIEMMKRSFEEQNAKRDKEFEEILRRLEKSERENIIKEIENLEIKKRDISTFLSQQEEKKSKAEKQLKRGNTCLCLLLLVVAVACIYAGLRLYRTKGSDSLAIVSFILSIVFFILPILLHISIGKPLDKDALISRSLQRRFLTLCRKNGYDEIECNTKKEELHIYEERTTVLKEKLQNQEVCI